jgi:hypothetical protein
MERFSESKRKPLHEIFSAADPAFRNDRCPETLSEPETKRRHVCEYGDFEYRGGAYLKVREHRNAKNRHLQPLKARLLEQALTVGSGQNIE